MNNSEHATVTPAVTHTLTVAQIAKAFALWNERHKAKTPEEAQASASWYDSLPADQQPLEDARYLLELTLTVGHLSDPTINDIRGALFRRGQLGLVSAHAGGMKPDDAERADAFWCGYLRALSELVDGTGAYLARKDAASINEPLSALYRAAKSLGEHAHHLTRADIEQRLREAGVEVSANAVTQGHTVGAEQLEHRALAAIGLHADHAAPQVAGNDHTVAHGGSVRAEGGAA